jgi:hypothetical protein
MSVQFLQEKKNHTGILNFSFDLKSSNTIFRSTNLVLNNSGNF